MKCPICDLSDGVSAYQSRGQDGQLVAGSDVSCPRCGGFSITDELIALFKEGANDQLRGYLSCYTRQLNERNERPERLTVQNWRECAERDKEPISGSRDRLLLQHAPGGQPELGERVEFKVVQDYPLLNVPSARAARLLIEDAKRRGLIDGTLTAVLWSGGLTPEGVEQVERIIRVRNQSGPAKRLDASLAGMEGGKRPARFETMAATYQRVEPLPEGGTGFVDKVKDETGNLFALKMLKPDEVRTERRKRFKNEVYIGIRLDHPNVVKVLDFGFASYRDTKCPFYLMKLYDSTLRKLMASIRDDPARILCYFRQMLDGVEAIHKCGSYHRDLKPENILFHREEDRLVVADLGIAHFQENLLATSIETSPGSRLHNWMYAAPEQRSRGDVDQRADIFALGLMLNEMFTGHVPQGRDYTTIVDVQPMLAYLDSLVEVMIQHHPGKRPQSIDEVRQALDHHLDASIQSEHQEYTKGETQYPGSITTFTFKGQPRYRCPQCKFDSYDLKKVQEHVRLNHAPAREGEAGGLYLLSWHAGSSYT